MAEPSTTRERRLQLVSLVLPLVFGVTMLWQLASAPEPSRLQRGAGGSELFAGGLTADEEQEVINELIRVQPEFWYHARKTFPEHHWSQRDHWQLQYLWRVQVLARKHAVSESRIQLLFDEAVRNCPKPERCLPVHPVPLEPRQR